MQFFFRLGLLYAMGFGDIQPDHLWDEANQAFIKGHYQQAVIGYQQLEQQGCNSGWLYYNLGNAYFRQEKLAFAIAAYRQSLLRLPREADVLSNLTAARQKTKDASPTTTEKTAILHTLFFWHFICSPQELWAAGALFNGLFWGVWLVLRLNPTWFLLTWIRYVCGICGLLVSLSAVVHHLWPQHVAIVAKEEIAVHSTTYADSPIRFHLHEGAEATVLATQGDWVRLSIGDDLQGWALSQDLLLLEL